jgi:hypothetical protein
MCMVAVYLAATILGVAFLYTLSYWIVGGKVSVHSVHKRYGAANLNEFSRHLRRLRRSPNLLNRQRISQNSSVYAGLRGGMR